MMVVILIGVAVILYAFGQALGANGRRGGEGGLIVPGITLVVVLALLGSTLGVEVSLFILFLAVVFFLILR